MTTTIPSTSLEYITIPVSGTDPDGQLLDLSGDTVEVAFVLDGAGLPTDDDWNTATWSSAGQAAILVGPGGTVELSAGCYRPFVRVSDNPERPVLAVPGQLRVT